MPDVGVVEMSEAISVKDKMPEATINTTLLLFAVQRYWDASLDQNKQWITGYLQDNDDGTSTWKFDSDDFDESSYRVTHWQPMPPDPLEDQ